MSSGWLPRARTQPRRQFLRPGELSRALRAVGLWPAPPRWIADDPGRDSFGSAAGPGDELPYGRDARPLLNPNAPRPPALPPRATLMRSGWSACGRPTIPDLYATVGGSIARRRSAAAQALATRRRWALRRSRRCGAKFQPGSASLRRRRRPGKLHADDHRPRRGHSAGRRSARPRPRYLPRLKHQGRRRAEAGSFLGHIAYASLYGPEPRSATGGEDLEKYVE